MTNPRPCTCHPDEAPVPCQQGYALSLCQKRALNDAADEINRLTARVKELEAMLRTASDMNEVYEGRLQELEGALRGLVEFADYAPEAQRVDVWHMRLANAHAALTKEKPE